MILEASCLILWQAASEFWVLYCTRFGGIYGVVVYTGRTGLGARHMARHKEQRYGAVQRARIWRGIRI